MIDPKVLTTNMSEATLNPVPDMCSILRGYVAAYRDSDRGQKRLAARAAAKGATNAR